MSDRNGAYKHFIPRIGLSIEQNTASVPNDGKFYIINKGKITGGFRSRKLAEEKFRELVKESGFKPELHPKEQLDPMNESAESYTISKSIFWAEGPKYKKRGGRGGRGGV